MIPYLPQVIADHLQSLDCLNLGILEGGQKAIWVDQFKAYKERHVIICRIDERPDMCGCHNTFIEIKLVGDEKDTITDIECALQCIKDELIFACGTELGGDCKKWVFGQGFQRSSRHIVDKDERDVYMLDYLFRWCEADNCENMVECEDRLAQ